MVYKYDKYSYLRGYFNNDNLVFVSPTKWTDPFERRFLNTNYLRFGFTVPEIACMCLTKSRNENEEALWSLRSMKREGYEDKKTDKNKVVKLTINIKTFLSELDKVAVRDSFKVYVGNVNYALAQNEILKLHEKSSPYYKAFFDGTGKPFDVSNYLNLLLLKRSSFKYENEIRIIIVKDGQLFKYDDGIYKVAFVKSNPKEIVLNTIVKRITFAPCNRVEKTHKLIVNDNDYNKINKEEKDLYYNETKQIKGLSSKIPVVKSNLYVGAILREIR